MNCKHFDKKNQKLGNGGKKYSILTERNTGVLAKKLDFAASIICKRCYKYLSNGIYYFQSQNNGDLAKKIYFDAGIICQICYNVFFQVVTYICQSVFNISRALTMVTWPRSLTLLLAVFILSLGLAFVTLAVWITLRYSCL